MNKFVSKFNASGFVIKFAVVCSHEADVLEAVHLAKMNKIGDFVLIGQKEKIVSIARQNNFEIKDFEIIDCKDDDLAAQIATKLVRDGICSSMLKGFIETSILLKAVLDKETGLRAGGFLSHVAYFIFDDREYFITDAAINIAPDKDMKKHIIDNAVFVANSLGYEKPNVACLCAKEHVNTKMPATVDAEYLQHACQNSLIKNCVVSGPLAFDNAISKEAAILKGIEDPVAGCANILLAPDIEAGNILYKALAYMSKCEIGCVVMGASTPIVITSRADSASVKLNSIILASYVANYKQRFDISY